MNSFRSLTDGVQNLLRRLQALTQEEFIEDDPRQFRITGDGFVPEEISDIRLLQQRLQKWPLLQSRTT